MVENELAHAKFKQLAKEEVQHRKLLIVLYKQMSGSGEKPSRIPGRPKTAEGGTHPG